MNANFSSSVLENPPRNASCEKPQLFYGGMINNTYFPAGFQFPIQRDIGCKEFRFYAIEACGYPHISYSTRRCLTKECDHAYISNNQTEIQEEFIEALEKRDPKYLTDEYFDLAKYSQANGFCQENSPCGMQEGFFYGNRTYDQLFFNRTTLDMNRKQMSHITNSKVSGGYLNMGNWTWENATFDSKTQLYFGDANILFRNVNFSDKISFWGNGENLTLDGCQVSNSWLGSSYFIFLWFDKFQILNSKIENSSITSVADQFIVQNSSLVNVRVGTIFLNSTYNQSDLNKVRFRHRPFAYARERIEHVFMSNAKEISLQMNDDKAFRYASFENIGKLTIGMDFIENSSKFLYWNFSKIGELSSNLSETSLNSPSFQDMVISGIWKGNIFGDRLLCNWGEPPIVRNVTFENMVLDGVKGCCEIEAAKVQDCLSKLGFKFGENVSFVHYLLPLIPQKSHKAAIIAGVFGGIFGFVVIGGVTLYCIKRKKESGKKEEPKIVYEQIN